MSNTARSRWRCRITSLCQWSFYFALALAWIGLVTLWVIEAGNPYP